MKKLVLILALMLAGLSFAQEAKKEEKESKLTASVDVVYPYLWRGVKYMGDRIAFQPYINYAITDKLTLGTWGSTNFSEAANAYNEIDLSITYAVTPEIKVAVSSYYWPATLQNTSWERSSWTDFSYSSAQTLDFTIVGNFAEKGIPVDFTWSTIFGGNDFKGFEYDAAGEIVVDADGEPTQKTRAYSSYAEVGYTWSPKKIGLDIRPFIGAVVNNGGYYPATGFDENGDNVADVKSFQLTNSGVNIAKTFHLNNGYDFPMFVRYTYNDNGYANPNTVGNEVKNFFSAGMTFKIY